MGKIKIYFLLLFASLIVGSSSSYAQKSGEEIKKAIDSQNFVFIAQTANPARGGFTRFNQLSSGYDVTVTKTSVISQLPFFGRAQIAPIGAADAGITFTSKTFDYKTAAGKKGWQVTIKPNDVPNVQQLYFTIYEDGTTDLNVVNTGRDNMSFRGYLK